VLELLYSRVRRLGLIWGWVLAVFLLLRLWLDCCFEVKLKRVRRSEEAKKRRTEEEAQMKLFGEEVKATDRKYGMVEVKYESCFVRLSYVQPW
jgi:hypothetical protein